MHIKNIYAVIIRIFEKIIREEEKTSFVIFENELVGIFDFKIGKGMAIFKKTTYKMVKRQRTASTYCTRNATA